MSDQDPWAWLHEQPAEAGPDWAHAEVVAFLTAADPAERAATRAAVAAGEVEPDQVREETPDAEVDAEWLWILPAGADPAPGALRRLLTALARQPELDIIGPLLVAPRRRGPGTVISQFGQTITGQGRLRPLVDPGELYQGQLESSYALGVDTLGLLVRGELWRDLGGLDDTLPQTHQGIDLGWRATLAGHLVAVEPTAQVIDRRPATDEASGRAAGLALVVAHTSPWLRWLKSLWLIVATLLAALGFVLGKDLGRAGDELTGMGRWLGNASLRRSVRARARAVPGTRKTRDRVRGLRPTAGESLRRAAEIVVDRFAVWLDTFTGRQDGAGIDELTGDDFAARGRTEPRWSVLVAGLLSTLVLAAVAARSLFGAGSLSGLLLLPAPTSWDGLLASYLEPVAGQSGLSGPAWAGLAGLASFITLGRPEVLVSVLVIGAVPLAWLLAFRLLRQLVASATVAGVAAFCYALAPALVGVLNLGSFGALAWTLLLPVLGYTAREWYRGGGWRSAAALGLWSLLAVALVPLAWPLIALAGIVVAVLGRRAAVAAQALLVVAGPALLLFGPWPATLAAYPGRLLTGTEPTLASTTAGEAWQLLLGRGAAGGSPELWISAVVVGGLWLIALAAALRRPRQAAGWLLVAGAAGAGAAGLTRLVLWVPPGEWARPLGLEWLVVMVGALVLAGVIGLDGVAAELRGSSLGLRHLGTLGLVGFAAVLAVLGGGWWVVAGQTGLHRAEVGALPAYVADLQTSPTPGRTLAIAASESGVSWSLVQDDYARLGQVERGLVFSGDPAASALATSVVSRLTSGSADDDLLGDLVRLGVSAIWLSGGDEAQRTAISNTPGLGLGTGDDTAMAWLVPDSGRAVTIVGEERTVVGSGVDTPGGGTLHLAEPADPRWWASVDGTPLQAVAVDEPGQGFTVTAAGRLEYGLAEGSRWWAWAQLAGLALLVLLAAPGVRRATAVGVRRPGARRASGGAA